MPSFCTQCGAELKPKTRFCTACGATVVTATASEPPLKPTKQASPRPRPLMKSHRSALFLGLALLVVGLGVAGGYFYVNAYRPAWVADLRAKFLGGNTPQPSTPTPTGLTVAQIHATEAERALAEGRLKEADDRLRQAEELEPGSPALQTLRARLDEAKAAVQRAEPALAQDIDFPVLTGRVVDEAGLLSPATRAEIAQRLAAHEQATTNQLVVVTLKSLHGYDIADYGYQLGRHWGIGQKGKNNGALLLVAPAERKMRIEVGYGLEGMLTDAVSRDIIERVIKPHLKQQHYEQGVLAGIGAILSALGGEY